MLVFDITNSKSFENLCKWLDDVKEYGPKDINIILVGNKLDLKFERQVSFEEAMKLAEKYDVPYIEVSALSGKNIPEIFEMLTKYMIKFEQNIESSRSKGKNKIDKSHVSHNNFSLDKSDLENFEKDKKSNSKCC